MTKGRKPRTPFVIWTMQRTGGTNFTKHLIAMSGLPAHQEPFNRPRIYGEVTQDWEKNRDIAATRVRMEEIVSEPKVIKHCVEMVPWRISSLLAEHTAAAKYGHLFLVRESSLQRLLSMEYARRTKVWGPSHEKPDEAADPAFDAPLEVDDLVAHEKMGIERLNEFWKQLVRAKARPIVISFEDLYESSTDDACARIEAVLEHLTLKSSVTTSDLVAQMREGGNQNTRDRYSRFIGISELEMKISNLPKFQFLQGAIDTNTQE